VGKHAVISLGATTDHPAIRAWRQIARSVPPSLPIDILKESEKSGVYRLVGAGPGSIDVIAKWARLPQWRRESQLYARILSRLPVRMLDVYGVVETDHGGWLFLEDAGSVSYSSDIESHRRLAVEWFGRMHAVPVPDGHDLPDAGAGYFGGVLTKVSKGVADARSHQAVTASGVERLDSVLEVLDDFEQSWTAISGACAGTPTCLVHGDVVSKNVRVTTRHGRPQLAVFDWETAGAGPPAADIAMLPDRDDEVAAYFDLLRQGWPEITLDDVRRLRIVGQLFRLLHALQWELHSFEFAWIERAMRRMGDYRTGLDRVRELGRTAW
jgi:hypothetical protein